MCASGCRGGIDRFGIGGGKLEGVLAFFPIVYKKRQRMDDKYPFVVFLLILSGVRPESRTLWQ